MDQIESANFFDFLCGSANGDASGQANERADADRPTIAWGSQGEHGKRQVGERRGNKYACARSGLASPQEKKRSDRPKP